MLLALLLSLTAHADYCASLEAAARAGTLSQHRCGILRASSKEKKIALVFTGGSFNEGYAQVREALQAVHGKGSFFLTGEYLRTFPATVKDMLAHGDYVGPHSNSHFQPTDHFGETVVSRPFFQADLAANLTALEKAGAPRPTFWILPNEDYNRELAEWSYGEGLKLFNFTPGTRANADYTGDQDSNFVSNAIIFQSILDRDELNTTGLNGNLLLLHVGVGSGRKHPFTERLRELLLELRRRGYTFSRIDEVL